MKKTFLLSIIFFIALKSEPFKAKDTSIPNIVFNETANIAVQSYRFTLTHLLGEKLKTPAYFKVGNMKKWTMDFRNGNKITYTIISKSGSNPLCGLNAKDSKGDYCTICVIPKPGQKVIISIAYGQRNFEYSGYLLR